MSIPRRAYNVLRGYINREWDRIQHVEREYAEKELNEALEAPRPSKGAPPKIQPVDRDTQARSILGVGKDASFSEIRKAYDRLNKRSDPANFPANSPEAAQAADIHKRVQWAYQVLSDAVDPTAKRFQSLEIE